MKVFSVIGIFAGMVIMGSLSAAHFTGQVDLTEMSWLWLTFFVGANLFQMGFRVSPDSVPPPKYFTHWVSRTSSLAANCN